MERRSMKILITGANGFIGKNLTEELKNRGHEILSYDIDSDTSCLDAYAKACEFVFHLAGVNRPEKEEDFMAGNFDFTEKLLACLRKYANTCPIALSSSIQAELDNPYGKSKKAGENIIFKYGKETGAAIYIYRFPNVFGKWSRPNYNSVVATFCHNIAHDLPIKMNENNPTMQLVYIDDLVDELIRALDGDANKKSDGYCYVPQVYEVKLHKIADLIYAFRESRKNISVPDMSDSFTKKLYSTYLSYLPENAFAYPLKMNIDNRGSFTEIIRTPDRGQMSVNITKPGITKGNHWHRSKNEKFVVVSGKAKISFRKIGTEKVIDYFVDGEKIETVDIPTGYTHNITNIGDTDLITLMWVNESYDPQKPDTFFQEV